MKTVYLLRHAKSAWGPEFSADFERPLAPRGHKAAARMGRELKARGYIPDLVLCSQARRAVETWRLVAPELDAEVPEKIMRSLYLAPPSRLIGVIHRQPDDLGSVMLIGHNPGMENLAAALAGPDSEPDALARMARKFPTAALALLRFEIAAWSKAEPGCGTLTHFIQPRDLD